MSTPLELKITADNKQALEVIQQTSGAVNQLGNSFQKLPQYSNQAGQALNNLSRIAQDAPYGFLGISNNINPLLESFQRLRETSTSTGAALKTMVQNLAGPAGLGLAVGIVSAVLVKFGDNIFKTGEKVKKTAEEYENWKNKLSETDKFAGKELANIASLVAAYDNHNLSLEKRKEILKELNTSAPQYFTELNTEKTTVENLYLAYAKYAENIYAVAQAKGASKEIEQLTGNLSKVTGRIQDLGTQLTNIKETWEVSFNVDAVKKNYDTLSQILKKTFVETADIKKISELTGIPEYKVNQLVSERNKLLGTQYGLINQIYDLSKKTTVLEDNKIGAIKKPEKEFDYVTAIKKRSVLSGQDTMEAVKEDTTIKDMEKSHQEHLNWLSKWYKFKMDLARKSGEENKKVLEDQQKSYESFAKQLSGSVVNALQGVYDAMQKGDSFGKAFLDMLGKITEQLIAMVIQTLIFRAIMAALTGGGSEVGIAASNVAGSAGRILMIPKYAEGGIVNKPHIGMVGEAGPEAIIPLNKLSGFLNTTFNAGAMSGGGGMSNGGSFVLKGNDLVLALQRSNHSLNLRRGI
jgi:predicted PurR-regulated permease PerM